MSKIILVLALVAMSAFAANDASVCTQSTLDLIQSSQQFYHDVNNGSYSEIFLANKAVHLIQDAELFLQNCGFPIQTIDVSEGFGNKNCKGNLFNVANDALGIFFDLKKGNILGAVTFASKLVTAAGKSIISCLNPFNEEEQQMLGFPQFDFTQIKMPFDYFGCIDATQKLYNMSIVYQTTIKGSNYFKTANDTMAMINQTYNSLDICGLQNVDTLLEKNLPRTCLNSMSKALNVGQNCSKLSTQPIQLSKCMAKFTIAANQAQANCPFLQNNTNVTPSKLMLPIIDGNMDSNFIQSLGLNFDWYSCVNAAQNFYLQAENFTQILATNNTLLIIAYTATLADQIYTLLPTCGLQKVENVLDDFLPEQCVNQVANAATLGYNCYQKKDQPIAFVKCMPGVTIAISKAQQSCPFLNNSTSTNHTL